MMSFQVLVMSEINNVYNVIVSDFNEVSEQSLLDCIFKSMLVNIGEDINDEELVKMFKESSLRIHDSREDVGNSFIFKNIDDDFVEIWCISVL